MIYPVTTLASSELEPNEIERIPLSDVCEPGVDPWEVAFEIAGPFRHCSVDYLMNEKGQIVGYIRIFSLPEEGTVVQEIDDEGDYELWQLERDEW